MARSMVLRLAGEMAAAYGALGGIFFAIKAGEAAVMEAGGAVGWPAAFFSFVVAFHGCIAVCGIGLVMRKEWARKGMMVCLGIQLGLAVVELLFSISPVPAWFGLHVSRSVGWLYAPQILSEVTMVALCVWMLRLLRRAEVREEFAGAGLR